MLFVKYIGFVIGRKYQIDDNVTIYSPTENVRQLSKYTDIHVNCQTITEAV